jgi:hypothetical protein
MEQRRYTKNDIIDAIIAEATGGGLFTGDKRDGGLPAIMLGNFHIETFRHGAKALRARLSRLSRAKLLDELNVAAKDVSALEELSSKMLVLAGQNERADAARALRQRQAELGRKHGLQPAILESARHYRRTLKQNAKEAWHAIKRKPFTTKDHKTVVIEGDGEKETMSVAPRGEKQRRSGIKLNHWQRRYWPAAKP